MSKLDSKDYFSRLSAQGKEVLAAGGFFCRACTITKPASEQSRNKRFCIGCYDSMQLDTAAVISPVRAHSVSLGVAEVVPKIKTRETTPQRVTSYKDGISGTTPGGIKKGRGRPVKVTPDETIRQLKEQGYAIRKIVKETKVPRSTVQRILSGQRSLTIS